MVQDSRIPIPGQRIAARLIDERAYLLDPRQEELQCLNEVGSFIWEQIAQRKFTIRELSSMVVDEFDVSLADAQKDLGEFLSELESREFVRYRD